MPIVGAPALPARDAAFVGAPRGSNFDAASALSERVMTAMAAKVILALDNLSPPVVVFVHPTPRNRLFAYTREYLADHPD